jgi:hypothetical protein
MAGDRRHSTRSVPESTEIFNPFEEASSRDARETGPKLTSTVPPPRTSIWRNSAFNGCAEVCPLATLVVMIAANAANAQSGPEAGLVRIMKSNTLISHQSSQEKPQLERKRAQSTGNVIDDVW